MNGPLAGAALGLCGSAGVLVAVRYAPPRRRIRLAERIGPYLPESPAPSRLLAVTAARRSGTAHALLAPALRDAARRVDRIFGGPASVRRRLDALGTAQSVDDIRLQQVLCGAAAMISAVLVCLLAGAVHGGADPVVVGVLAIGALAGGVLARDRALSRAVTRREAVMIAEFPVVADLLALAVVAGESPVEAMARVCRLTSGEIAHDLASALAAARAGAPITRALTDLAGRTSLEPFARFLTGLVVAIERGTPLAGVLRAQAADVREARKRALLEAGGRKEISMMVPIVFLILPVTVVFALYPGLLTLTTFAR